MKNWKFSAVAAILATVTMFMLCGCMHVPKTTSPRQFQEGVYFVNIKKEFDSESSIRYAINEYVKSIGGASYDYEPARDLGSLQEYLVRVPGAIPVEDLPKVQIFNFWDTFTLVGVLSPVAIILFVLLGSL